MGKRKSSRHNQPTDIEHSRTNLEVHTQHFQGSIPPPEILEKYENIVPGSAERIISMAEVQGEHRRVLEAKVIDKDSGRASRGQVFAFIIAMTIIIGGFFMIWQGKSLEGLASIITVLTALVGVFVYGKVSKNKNLRNRR